MSSEGKVMTYMGSGFWSGGTFFGADIKVAGADHIHPAPPSPTDDEVYKLQAENAKLKELLNRAVRSPYCLNDRPRGVDGCSGLGYDCFNCEARKYLKSIGVEVR